MNDCITTTKQSTTKSCAYFLGYTVVAEQTGRGEISGAVPIWPPQSVALNCGHPTQWLYTQCGPAVAVMFSSCWHEKQKSLQLRRTRRQKRTGNIKSPQTRVTWWIRNLFLLICPLKTVNLHQTSMNHLPLFTVNRGLVSIFDNFLDNFVDATEKNS